MKKKWIVILILLISNPLFASQYEGTGTWQNDRGNSGTYQIQMDIQKYEKSDIVKIVYTEPYKTRSIILKFQEKGFGQYDVLVPYTMTPGKRYCLDSFCHMQLPGDGQFEESWKFSDQKLETWGSRIEETPPPVQKRQIIWKEVLLQKD